jgi:putative tryptophan/tyrosine transport system substrate-binding protein
VRITVLGQTLHLAKVVSENDIEAAFAALVQERATAVCCAASEFPNLAPTSHRVGGMPRIAYQLLEQRLRRCGRHDKLRVRPVGFHRGAGIYAGRILKGEKPAELPVMQATKFEFVINLTTAKALGLTIPPTMLLLATEVVE